MSPKKKVLTVQIRIKQMSLVTEFSRIKDNDDKANQTLITRKIKMTFPTY